MWKVIVNGKTKSTHKTRDAAGKEAQRIRAHNTKVLADLRRKGDKRGYRVAPSVSVKKGN